MRVALLQVASPDDESFADRQARVNDLVLTERTLADADLLILPELWAVGCFLFDRYRDAAEPFDGPSLALARAWAARHDIHVHLGSFVEADGDQMHNTAAVVAPSGEVLTKYRKIHLFGRDEARLMTPGDALDTIALHDFDLSLATCYDLRFPELFRSMIDAGANVTAVPAAWPKARHAHWQLFSTVRAVEEQMYVIACNAVGTQNSTVFGGGSRVVDPWGNVVAEADDTEGFTYADLDPAMPSRVRAGFPALADRRWD